MNAPQKPRSPLKPLDEALADLLAGTKGYAFTGRLPFPWPSTTCPTNGYPLAEQLFARGYGLSYAKPTRTGRLAEAPTLTACP